MADVKISALTEETAVAAADRVLTYDADGSGTQWKKASAEKIVDRGLTELGITPQNRISTTTDPTANDDGAGTNGTNHLVNDLWTNTSTDETWICQDISTGAAVWTRIDDKSRAAQMFMDFLVDLAGKTISFSGTSGELLAGNGCVTKADLTRFRQARVIVVRGSTTDAGTTIALRGKSGAMTLTYGDYADIGDGGAGVEVTCPNALTAYVGSWVDLAAAYQDDVALAVVVYGNGSTGNHGFVRITVEFR